MICGSGAGASPSATAAQRGSSVLNTVAGYWCAHTAARVQTSMSVSRAASTAAARSAAVASGAAAEVGCAGAANASCLQAAGGVVAPCQMLQGKGWQKRQQCFWHPRAL